MNQSQYDILYNFLSKGVLPDGLNPSKKIRITMKAKNYVAHSNELFYKDKKGVMRKVVKFHDKRAILNDAHSNAMTGEHYGTEATMVRLKSLYFWAGMYIDVLDFIKDCATCEAGNKQWLDHPEDKAESFDSEECEDRSLTVWKQVQLFLFCHLPTTSRGNRHVAVLLDEFTQWPEIAILTNKSPIGVAEFISSTVCRYGLVETLIADLDRGYRNEINKALIKRLGQKNGTILEGLPLPSGKKSDTLVCTSVTKRMLQGVVDSVVNEHVEDWDLVLETEVLRFRQTPNPSTGCSPFYLMLGRHPPCFSESPSENSEEPAKKKCKNKDVSPTPSEPEISTPVNGKNENLRDILEALVRYTGK